MVAETEVGKGAAENSVYHRMRATELAPEVKGAALVRRYQTYAEEEGVFTELFDCLRRNLNAQTSIRIPGGDHERGFEYEKVDDGMVQVAAARVLAQILRLLPSASAGVNITTNDNSVNVTVTDKLIELERIGVTREQLRSDMEAILQVVRPAEQSPDTSKSLSQ